MKFITRYTDYALRSLLFLASQASKESGKCFKVDEVAKELNLPRAQMRRIFQTLAKEEILKSCKGRSGGFELNVNPKDVSMVDIIKIFQGPIDLSNCFLQKDICPNKPKCAIRAKLEKVSKIVEQELNSLRLDCDC